MFEYCKAQIDNGEELMLQELANTMPTLNNLNFTQFTQEKAYDLAENIPPVRMP